MCAKAVENLSVRWSSESGITKSKGICIFYFDICSLIILHRVVLFKLPQTIQKSTWYYHTYQHNVIPNILIFANLIGNVWSLSFPFAFLLLWVKLNVSMYWKAIHVYFFYESSHHIIFPLNYCIVDLFLSIYRNSLYIKNILSMMSMQIFFLGFLFHSYSKIYDLWVCYFYL